MCDIQRVTVKVFRLQMLCRVMCGLNVEIRCKYRTHIMFLRQCTLRLKAAKSTTSGFVQIKSTTLLEVEKMHMYPNKDKTMQMSNLFLRLNHMF